MSLEVITDFFVFLFEVFEELLLTSKLSSDSSVFGLGDGMSE